MTATIRTESGVMVEARVGDVVRFDEFTSLDKVKIIIVDKVNVHLRGIDFVGSGNIAYLPALCTLLHRPFAVGDDVEQEVHPDCWESQAKISCIDKSGVWCGNSPQVLVSQFGEHIRHADPALRDHSQYERSE